MARRAVWLFLVLVAVSACAERTPKPHFESTAAAVEERDQPVTANDLRILERADQILGDETVWDRTDDRTCDPAAQAFSLFCALQKASIEVLGGYQHRRVALQEVRFAIEDVTGGREFEHRMMDFNNLAETTFADIKKVLSVARQRVADRLAKQPTESLP